jgi:hypothetical protein
VGDDPSDVQAYIMEKNPTWSVPEKRRLQKFLKRATSNQSTPSPSPSTPASQSEAESNNELDNRSERSRSSRFKGIASRLFGSSNSKSNLKATAFDPPLHEIQTTTETIAISTEESIKESNNQSSLVPLVTQSTDEIIQEEIMNNTHSEMISILVPEEDKTTANTSASTSEMTSPTTDELPLIYKDDNDGTIVERDRCWCLFC